MHVGDTYNTKILIENPSRHEHIPEINIETFNASYVYQNKFR